MRAAVVLLLLSPWLLGQSTEKDVLEKLQAAFRGSNEFDMVEAVKMARGVADPEAIKLVAKGLRQSSYAVREAAIDTLGHTQHPEALKQLHSYYWRDKTLSKKSEYLFAKLLTEIARHGDKSSIKVLKDHPYRNLTLQSGRARIIGASNIRHRDAVEALIKATRKSGGQRDPGFDRFSGWTMQFRNYMIASLTILTGQNIGPDIAVWNKWWSGAKNGYKVSPERPANIPDEYKKLWEQQFGEPYGGAEDKDGTAKELGSPYGRIENPGKERVAEAMASLKQAFRDKDAAVRVTAIEQAGGVIDRDVLRFIAAKGLADKQPEVQTAAIDVLGWSKHPDALKQLHRYYRRHLASLSKSEPEVFALLLKSIGRHGKKSSIRVLEDSPVKNLTLASGRARILGLANVREADSLKRILKWMQMASGEKRHSTVATRPRFLADFRVALVVLTGLDKGMSEDAWLTWWTKDAKRRFKVTAARPTAVPDDVKAAWEKYWGEAY